MQTAFSITDVIFSADPVEPGIVDLSVKFQIFNNGPSHVAGLIVTTDFWITSEIAPARFQGFGAGFEFWQANFSAGGPPVTFEFVIFCDDFGGDNTVPRIWNTNGGNRFKHARESEWNPSRVGHSRSTLWCPRLTRCILRMRVGNVSRTIKDVRLINN
jgi:hypothetical protein